MFSLNTYRHLFSVLFILAVCITVSCRKVPKFSETPSIEFLNITKGTYFDEDIQASADSVTIGIRIKDGNGDIGQEPLNRTDENINYFIDVYRRTHGTYLPVILTGVTYNGHTPLLSPISTPGPIEGEIYYKINFTYSFSQVQNDTLKFVVKIKDRAGNMSNSIDTDPVIIRQTL